MGSDWSGSRRMNGHRSGTVGWSGRLATFLGALVLQLSLNGCDTVEDAVQATFPPLDVSEAVGRAKETFKESAFPERSGHVALWVSAEEVKSSIHWLLGQVEGVDNIHVSLREQTIEVSADFVLDRKLPDSAIVLKDNSLTVTGRLRGVVTPRGDLETNRILFDYLLDAVEINKITIANNTASEALEGMVVAALNSFLNYINGFLNRECKQPEDDRRAPVPPCFVLLPNPLVREFRLAEEIEGEDIQAVSARPVVVFGTIDRIAIKVSPRGLGVLARFGMLASGSTGEIPKNSTLSYADVSKSFDDELIRLLGDSSQARASAAVDTRIVASIVDHLATSSDLSIQAKIAPETEQFSSKVRLAKQPQFSCDPDMDCKRENCRKVKCEKKKERKCIKAGGDIAKALNEVCRTVEKTVCEGGKAVDSLVCEVAVSLEKGLCESAKSLKKAGCEGNKVFVDKVLGRVGNVSGDYTVRGAYAIGLNSTDTDDNLRALRARLKAAAAARVDGSLKFTPVDHGHLLVCQHQWKEGFDVGVVVTPFEKELSATLASSRSGDDGTLTLKYEVDAFKLSGRVTPSPFSAIFDQHPHLRINCAIPAAAGDLARLVSLVDGESDILPDELNEIVTGEVKREIKRLTFDVDIPPLEVDARPESIRLAPHLGDQSLVFN